MELIVRCSSLDAIMTNDRSGKKMGETAKKEFRKIFIRAHYGREEVVKSKYLDKGHEREEDAITLLTRVNGRVYKNNKERLTNEFVTGEWDVFSGDEIIDTKCSWSLFSFLDSDPDDYKWQRVGYMWLTGATKSTVAYCLVNGTAKHIMDEKRKASYDYGLDPDVHPEYVKRCQLIERNHIFDMAEFVKENPGFDFHSDLTEWEWNIPKKERVKQFTIDRNEADIESVKARIIEGRQYLTKEFTLSPVTSLAVTETKIELKKIS